MEQIWVAVCNRAIAAGWLILVIALLRLVFKNGSKRIRLYFWIPVALRLLFAKFPKSVFALVPDFWVLPQQDGSSMRTPAIDSGVPAVNHLVNPVLAQNFPSEELSGSVNSMQAVLGAMILIWFVGAVLLACYSMFSYIRLRLGTRDAVLVKYMEAKSLIPVYQSEKIASPYTVGILSPRIYVPSNLTEVALGHVLAHEVAHIRHQDHWIKGLAWLLVIVYWPFPLLWLGWYLFCKDLELACDERVISQLGPMERCSYSETLLLASAPKRHGLSCPLAFGTGDIKERVKSILQYRPPSFWAIVLAAGSILILAVFFLTTPQKALALPDAKELAYVDIRIMDGNEEKTLTVEDAAWNASLLTAMANASKTGQRPVNSAWELGNIDDHSYAALTLCKADGTSLAYYLYSIDNKYYLAQPSAGIYSTDEACHSLLMECMADKEADLVSVSYGLHRLGKGGSGKQDISPMNGTQTELCRQIERFYVENNIDKDKLITELRRQLGYDEDSMTEAEIVFRDTGVQLDENSYGKAVFDAAAIETLEDGYQIDRWITGAETVQTLYVYEKDGMPYVQRDGDGAVLLDQALYDALVDLKLGSSGS